MIRNLSKIINKYQNQTFDLCKHFPWGPRARAHFKEPGRPFAQAPVAGRPASKTNCAGKSEQRSCSKSPLTRDSLVSDQFPSATVFCMHLSNPNLHPLFSCLLSASDAGQPMMPFFSLLRNR